MSHQQQQRTQNTHVGREEQEVQLRRCTELRRFALAQALRKCQHSQHSRTAPTIPPHRREDQRRKGRGHSPRTRTDSPRNTRKERHTTSPPCACFSLQKTSPKSTSQRGMDRFEDERLPRAPTKQYMSHRPQQTKDGAEQKRYP